MREIGCKLPYGCCHMWTSECFTALQELQSCPRKQSASGPWIRRQEQAEEKVLARTKRRWKRKLFLKQDVISSLPPPRLRVSHHHSLQNGRKKNGKRLLLEWNKIGGTPRSDPTNWIFVFFFTQMGEKNKFWWYFIFFYSWEFGKFGSKIEFCNECYLIRFK